MRLAIMQPYFLPYLGYWQLMNFVDAFVVYDDIQYTKKGWINRNRYLSNGKPETFTLPLKKASDFLDVRDRQLSDDREQHFARLVRRIHAAYKSAPFMREGCELLESLLRYPDNNLFGFVYNSISVLRSRLGLTTKLLVSSELDVPNGLSGQDRVIAICNCLGAHTYINPIGGVPLYSGGVFQRHGIRLQFQSTQLNPYRQLGEPFVPGLSVLDAIMFMGVAQLRGIHLAMTVFEDQGSD